MYINSVSKTRANLKKVISQVTKTDTTARIGGGTDKKLRLESIFCAELKFYGV